MRRSPPQHSTHFPTGRLLGVVAVATAAVLTGCSGEAPADSHAAAAPSEPAVDEGAVEQGAVESSAQAILQALVAAYQKASTYQDAGVLFQQAAVGGVERQSPPVPYSVSLQRPNLLRAHLLSTVLVADGKKTRAAVQELADQVLEAAAPARVDLTTLPADAVLQQALMLESPLLASTQLTLLLAASAEKALPADAAAAELLDEAETDGHTCHRVRLRVADGQYVYWIDKETPVLRRLDLPTGSVERGIPAEQSVSDLTMWLEFKGAALDGPIDAQAFTFEIPSGAKRLTQFVTPIPGPRPPRIGEVIDTYQFEDLEGNPIDAADLAGKVKVLDFWFTTCPPCRMSTPVLEELHQKYHDRDDVGFLAVSIDRPDLDAAKIEQTLRGWGATMPIARDMKDQSQSTFQIPGAPTTFLLGPDGKVHGYKVGYHPDYKDLAAAIDGLLQGEDVAARILAKYEAEVQDYQMRLAAAAVDAETSLIEVPQTRIAPKSLPQSVQLTKQWDCPELTEPGNIVVVRGAGPGPEIYVLDRWKEVVQINSQGAVVSRHDLGMPDKVTASILRTTTDSTGRRLFVVSGTAQQQVHLFDPDWQKIWSFPTGQQHDGVADVQLADLDGDDRLEILVGYWGKTGVQGITEDGKLLWSNRSLENVMQMAVTAPVDGRRSLLCINSRGTLVPIDDQGRHTADVRVAERALIQLVGADVDGDGTRDYCGLAAQGIGKRVAVGITADGAELWSYRLPEGVQKHPVDPIVPALLAPGDGGWLLPGPDGSIHFLTKDGQLLDQFAYGSALTGLAITEADGAPLLLIASKEGLTAWQVTIP